MRFAMSVKAALRRNDEKIGLHNIVLEIQIHSVVISYIAIDKSAYEPHHSRNKGMEADNYEIEGLLK